MASSRMVTIQGAGITGTTLALALARSGASRPRLLDLHTGPLPAQPGVWLGPRALSVLERLQVAMPRGAVTSALTVCDPVGRVMGRAPVSGLATTRAALLAELEAAFARVSGNRVELGASVTRVLHSSGGEDGAEAGLTLRQKKGEVMRTSALVGCDGAASGVRGLFWPHGARSAVSSGVALWQLRVSVPLADSGAVHEWWGRTRRLTLVPLGNSVWSVTGAQALAPGAVAPQALEATRTPAQFVAEFAPFFEGPEARALFAAASAGHTDGLAVLVTPGVRVAVPHAAVHPTLPVLLAGDAVHGHTPDAAWGVTLALEDAYTLAQAPWTRAGWLAWAAARQRRWAEAVHEARQFDRLLRHSGTTRIALRTLAMRWGGNRLVAKRLRRAHLDELTDAALQ